MADVVTIFAAEIPTITAEEQEWIHQQWTYAKEFDEDGRPVESDRWVVLADAPCNCEPDDPSDITVAPFEWELRKGTEGDNHLILRAAEGGCHPEVIGYVIQKFLQEFRPRATFTLTWASYMTHAWSEGCGGALAVSAHSFLFMFTGDVARELEQQLAAQSKA